MSQTTEALGAAKRRMSALARSTPDFFGDFSSLSGKAMAAGQLSPGTKELMAIAIAVVQGCDDCILYHVERTKQHGSDEAQLVEALQVAIEMGGGPAVMYAARALDAFRAS